MTNHKIFALGNVQLQSGETLHDAKIAYQTYGTLNAAKDNVVLLPTFYTGTHKRNEAYFGPGRAIDPARHFIISPNTFGNGLSSSPSNATPPSDGARFPHVTHFDNVACQHIMLREVFGITQLALVAGWSMGASQSYQWASQYPEMVKAIVPFCGSARCAPHNYMFLAGVKAALQADPAWNNGRYTTQPERGLRAFGRVYAGWVYSQTWFREGYYKQLGFETLEDMLEDWERDHLEWDANDLLAKIWTWQHCDISENDRYNGDFPKALASIRARAILIPCTTDLYFPPEDNEIEARYMPRAEFRPFASVWGHAVPSGNRVPEFHRFLDAAVAESMAP